MIIHYIGALSIRAKIILSYVLLVFIPVVVSAALFSNHYLKLMEKTVVEDALQTNGQILMSIDSLVSEAKTAVNYLKYNDNLLAVLKNYSESVRVQYPDLFDQLRLDEYMIDIFKSNSSVEGIYIVSNNDTIFHQQKLGVLKTDYIRYVNDWRKQLLHAEAEMILLPTHEQEILTFRSETTPLVVSLVSVIKSYDQRTWGIICIDINLKAIEKSMVSARHTGTRQTIVTDTAGNIIYPYPQKVDLQVREILNAVTGHEAIGAGEEKSRTFTLNNRKYIAAGSESSSPYWKVLNVMPYKEVAGSVIQIRNNIFILFGIFLFLFVVGAFVFSRYITEPVRKLIMSFREVDKGNLDVSIDVGTTDEIGLMCHSFNKMVNNLKVTIRDNYEMKIREKESELSVLQSQINPHFLYNALEMISMTAVMNNDYQCSEMLNKLGNTLRYTINNYEKRVSLQKEMTYLESYLGLFRLRFPHIELVIDVPDALMPMCILKMSIQPFVENILVHAQNKDALVVHITASLENRDTLVVTVGDNGGGIPPDRLAFIRKQISNKLIERFDSSNTDAVGGSTGIGIVNTSKRMVLEYGEDYGVEVSNVKNGTEIRLKYPVSFE